MVLLPVSLVFTTDTIVPQKEVGVKSATAKVTLPTELFFVVTRETKLRAMKVKQMGIA